MSIRELRVANLRSYELFSARFDPAVTVIIGQNGTGKTSLLEGIYYLMQGTSFRGRDRDMIAHISTRTDLVLIDTNEDKRTASLQITPDNQIKKAFTIRDRTTARIPAAQRRPVVLFEPDELRLLTSSPERRRRFFDGILARLYPHYGTILNRYTRTLMQRNELLKRREVLAGSSWDDQLFIWDMKLAELALEITRQRREFVVVSNSQMSARYSRLAESEHHVTISYHSNLPDEHYQQRLLDRLHSERIADSYRGHTSVGPHRDDFLILLDGHLASETASRGELRSIMLAYKLLEVDLQHETSGRLPLILLDDVFSELDIRRETMLMESLKDHQTIITATDLRDGLTTEGSVIELK